MPLSLAEATAQLTAEGQPFEVAVESVGGRPTRVWKNCPPSLRTILELSRGHGGKTFLVYEDDKLTFEEHFTEAAAFARYLVEECGIKRGDRVAIAMRNFPEWVISFWAAAAVGAVVVPLNAWWTGPELAYGLEDSGASLAVVDAERLERLRQQLSSLKGLRIVVARPEDRPEHSEIDESELSRHDEIGAVLERYRGGPVELPPVEIAPDDNATIFYTSGTTGKPKGALGTHRNICTNLMSLGFVNARGQLTSTVEHLERIYDEGGQNAYLLTVPLFHATGCHAVLVANTAVGGKLVLMRRFDPERALELIERERVTMFGGVPTMAWRIIESPEFEKRDTSSVRAVSYGGAPAPPELLRKVRARFPSGSASNGYGLTETSSVTTLNSGEDYFRKPDSVGPPVPVCEVKVVTDSGKEVPTGATGELLVKGPNVVRGYWNKPDESAVTFVDGWLHTGDVAKLDAEGFVYIVDRAKDMVIRGGENVYSAEVEAAIFEHPAISDAAVIGVPHEVLGEEVGAVVVLKPGSTLSAAQLQDHLGERIAAFMVPSHVFFYEGELPRNPAGKVLKRALRDEVLA